MIKPLIYLASYIWFPFALLCLWLIVRKPGVMRWLSLATLILSLPLAWARFIEPRLLFVHEESLDLRNGASETAKVRIALFSDTHFGVYPNAMPMRRIVDRINLENVDAVMIAGDFLYELPSERIPEAISPLSNLNAPVFAVMGNHDVGFPGPLYGSALFDALREAGVILVENRSYDLILNGQSIVIAGTSDLWQGQYDFEFEADFPDGAPVLLLTHNPDMAFQVPSSVDFDLMLAGHTHGGQIRLPIPGLTRRVIPTNYPFDTGLHYVPLVRFETPKPVFVTPGTGMVGLPMRFRRPPRIDILTLTVPAQSE